MCWLDLVAAWVNSQKWNSGDLTIYLLEKRKGLSHLNTIHDEMKPGIVMLSGKSSHPFPDYLKRALMKNEKKVPSMNDGDGHHSIIDNG